MLTGPLLNKRQIGFVKRRVSHSPLHRSRLCPAFCGVSVELRAACESLMKGRRCTTPHPPPQARTHTGEGGGRGWLDKIAY